MRIALHGMPKNRQRGDTIVEVLISVAVVSLILGGAYVTTNRSLQATRGSQERGTALKLAESQMELLKGLMATTTGSAAVLAMSSSFCISQNTGNPALATADDCHVGSNGLYSPTEPIFRLSIGPVSGSDRKFKLTETWTDVSGRQTDSLEMQYRVYE